MTVSLSTEPSQEHRLFTSRDVRPPGFDSFKAPKEIKGAHHRASVRCLGWSTDARRLASGGTDKVVRVWTPERSLAERSSVELRGHTETVDALAWDPTHPERVATASTDKTVRVWDIRTQAPTFTAHTPGANINLTFHPKGHLIAVGNREDVLSLIDVRAGGKILGTIKPTGPSTSSGSAASSGPKEEINEVAWSNGGGVFVATTGTGYVRVLDARIHNDVEPPRVASESASANPSAGMTEPSGKARDEAAKASEDAVMADATTATDTKPLAAATNPADPVPWSPIHTLVAHTATIFCAQFDPLGRYLATASADATVACWTLPEFQSHWMAGKDLNYPPRSLSFSHDGEFLAAGGEDPFVWIGSTVDGSTVYKLPTGPVPAQANGATMAAAAPTMNAGAATVNALAWNPARYILAYAGEEKVPGHEGTIRIWGL